MAIDIRDFELMVNSVLGKIMTNTSITNNSPGSVIRTIVESIIAEYDIQYYQLLRLYNAMGIDTATDDDLDRLVSIFGVIRKAATKCSQAKAVTFGRTEPSIDNIIIPYGTIVSTKKAPDGTVVEFMTNENTMLPAGDLEVSADIIAIKPGITFVPQETVCVLNDSIIGISYVINHDSISGGSEVESDDSVRARTKNVLIELGRGTCNAVRSAILRVGGVNDAIVNDLARGVGTADVIVVTDTIPPSQELQNSIMYAASETKSAGIDVQLVYPTILPVDVTITTTGSTDINIIGGAIVDYIKSLTVGSTFIINQMERSIINACDNTTMDITTTVPSGNVVPSATQIIRHGIITINGEVYNVE